MRRASMMAVAAMLASACGPEDDTPTEVQRWMAGGWSSTLMTRAGMLHVDGGSPSNYYFEPDGVFVGTLSGDWTPQVRTWAPVSESEVFVHAAEDDYPATEGFSLRLTTGERGCDKLEVWHVAADDESYRWDLYRGAVCAVSKGPCPPDPPDETEPGLECEGYYHRWCDPLPDCSHEDCYCHL